MSREVEVLVPDIGDFDAVDVVEILVAPGDRVAIEDPLVSLESDKATMEVPSPVAGEVLSVKVSLGDAVSEGSLLIVVAASDEVAAPTRVSDPSSAPPMATDDTAYTEMRANASMPSVQHSGGRGVDRPVRAHAAPGVRRAARELGVDLAQIDGSGSVGRVLEADVKNHVRETFERGGGGGGGGPPAALERQADVSDLETWRRRIPVPEGQLQPSTLAVVLKALLAAVRAFPDLMGGAGEPMHVGVQGRPGGDVATGDSEAPLVVVPDAWALGLRALASALEESADTPSGDEAPPAEPVFRLQHRLGGLDDGLVQRPDPVRSARERFAVAVGGLEVVPHWTGTAEDALAGEPAGHFEPRVVVSLAVSLAPDLPPELGSRFLEHWAEILGAPARLLL